MDTQAQNLPAGDRRDVETGVRQDRGRTARTLVERLKKRAKERDAVRWNSFRYDWCAADDADMLNEAAALIEEML